MVLGILAIFAAVVSVAICACAGGFGSLAWLWMLPAGFVGAFLLIALLFFIFLMICCALVDIQKPQEKDSRFYRGLTYFVAKLAIELLQVRVHTKGMENVPKDGRILMVSNHLNDMDPVVRMYYFRKKQLAFISKRENSTMFVVGKLLHRTMCQMINRENDREALKTILKCVQLIREDEVSIGVFPEGYTSLDGLLHPFRNGVFKIAQKAQVPIVVCTLQNTQYIFRNALKLKPTDVHLHMLGVIPVEEIQGVTAVDIGRRVHKMMADDLGPDLVLPESE